MKPVHAAIGTDGPEGCKGCSSSVHVTEAQIERLLSKLKAEDCVSDDVYKRRLQACYGCESLLYGTTCRLCGCLVRIHAKLASQGCPRISHASWSTKFE